MNHAAFNIAFNELLEEEEEDHELFSTEESIRLLDNTNWC